MRVLVTGAYGLIGSHVAARLHADGHRILGAGRSLERARRRWPHYDWIAADFRKLTRPEDWAALLGGVDAVVNCVGVLQDSPTDDIRAAHVLGADALFAACERAGIRRVVHVSAVGLDAGIDTGFAETKREAERRLRTRDLDWVILRPSLVVAPGAWGGGALIRALATLPFRLPVTGADRPFQPVDIDDVTATIAFFLGPGGPSRLTLALGGPEPMPLAHIVLAFRAWLGLRPAPVLPVPERIAAPAYRLGDLAARLGWRPPLRSTAGRQLAFGALADPAEWSAVTGIVPKSLAETLAGRPSTVQDRWFARLYLLKPVAIVVLAAYWITTGIISIGPGFTPGVALLRRAGFGGFAGAAVLAGALVDMALGAALLVRRTAKAALQGMLVVSLFYLVTATAVLPRLWADPLGPLLKVLPVMALTLMVLAILDER